MAKNTSPKSPRILKVCKDRNYDCVYVNKRKIMLGRSGTPEAQAALLELQIQLFVDPSLSYLNPQEILVDSLCLAYLKYAKENNPGHFFGIKTAVEILLKQFAGQPIESLDSVSFLYLQDLYVSHGVSRQYCNMLMGYIRAMLKWGIIRKLSSEKVLFQAKLIPALKKGKTKARENKKRKAVPDEIINQTLPHLLPTIRDMVLVQRLASMRPNEIYRMKVGEIDTNGHISPEGVVIWIYTPEVHKNSWREKDDYIRRIPLGKPEQDIIAPRLVGKSDADFVFSPKDTVKERKERDAAKRKNAVQPSQIKRKERNAKNPKRRDRDSYDKDSYNRAIKRSIHIANKRLPDSEQIVFWTPYQLRHSGVTELVLRGGLESARAVAGHSTTEMT